MATVMTETTTAKVREEQVTGLTAENAHRVTMIREKGTDHPPVPFHFRKEHHGTGNYVHLYGNPEDRNELHSRDFKDWEAVAFKHPGYLEDMWKQACDAYAWSSFDPEIRGETDIMIYGEELHNDLNSCRKRNGIHTSPPTGKSYPPSSRPSHAAPTRW